MNKKSSPYSLKIPQRIILYDKTLFNSFMFCKSMDWFLYDRNLRHEKIKRKLDSDINSSAVISRVNRFLSIPSDFCLFL